MDLNTLWFGIITVLFIGFFFLEGFDYGVGILMPFVGKNEAERRVVISSIGPFWDGNEVWMIVAVAGMFAAFPGWYATLFSGFYFVMFTILVTLILRGVAFEFRNRDSRRRWRAFWDAMIFLGSLVPALLWGVTLTNLLKGVAIDAKQHYVGGTFELFNLYSLLGGLTFVALFVLHGAVFLSLKTEGRVMARASKVAKRFWLVALVLVGGFGAMSYFNSEIAAGLDLKMGLALVGALVALVAGSLLFRAGRQGWAFVMTALTVALTTSSIFLGLFPRVMVSSLSKDWSLTIYNSSSTANSLSLTSWLALGLVPVIILYQAWNYWVFRKRVSYAESHHI
jgi:cytochrome d ubiquinol oxidase subunit II